MKPVYRVSPGYHQSHFEGSPASHALRHTRIVRAILANVPLRVIAARTPASS